MIFFSVLVSERRAVFFSDLLFSGIVLADILTACVRFTAHGTVAHLVPDAFPFFSPRERTLANGAHLRR